MIGYFSSKDRFVSIPETLESLPDHRKEAIANHVQDIINRLEISDLQQLIAIAMALSSPASGSTTAAILTNPMLRTIFDGSIEYIRNQVEEEHRQRH